MIDHIVLMIRMLLLLVVSITTQILSTEIASRLHRIAFGSCYRPTTTSGLIWNQIYEKKPELLLLLGDNIYSDKRHWFHRYTSGNPTKIRKLYDLFLNDNNWKILKSSLSLGVNAIYDDHDYGLNNADKYFKYRNDSMQLFWDFMNESKSSSLRKQNGVYNSKLVHLSSGFTYKIILLDTRSNKDRKDTANGDFLGYEQWKWLINELTCDPLPDLFIIGSSIQILPTDKFIEESWNEFPLSREKLLHIISLIKSITNVLLISGDVHYAEFSQVICNQEKLLYKSNIDEKLRNQLLNSKLIEFTSSGLSHTATRTLPYDKPNKNNDIPSKGDLISSRGWIIQQGNDWYQALSSFHFREHRYLDYYQGINFGLIDILLYNDTSSLTDNKNEMRLHISDHSGDIVSTKVIPLEDKVSDDRIISQTFKSVREQLNNQMNVDIGISLCTPIHGIIPYWRLQLFKAIVSIILLFAIVLPFLYICWLVFASIWYIFYHHEQIRRERLMESYLANAKNE